MKKTITLITVFGLIAACKAEAPPAAAPKPMEAKKAEPPPAPANAPAEPAAAAAPAGDDATAAKDIYNTRCVPCHGVQGAGDGPASAGLTPRPASFQSAEWQAGVTDEHVEKIIQFGGAAVGKSPAMPPNPDLVAKPGVVKALRAHVRGLKGSAAATP